MTTGLNAVNLEAPRIAPVGEDMEEFREADEGEVINSELVLLPQLLLLLLLLLPLLIVFSPRRICEKAPDAPKGCSKEDKEEEDEEAL